MTYMYDFVDNGGEETKARVCCLLLHSCRLHAVPKLAENI